MNTVENEVAMEVAVVSEVRSQRRLKERQQKKSISTMVHAYEKYYTQHTHKYAITHIYTQHEEITLINIPGEPYAAGGCGCVSSGDVDVARGED